MLLTRTLVEIFSDSTPLGHMRIYALLVFGGAIVIGLLKSLYDSGKSKMPNIPNPLNRHQSANQQPNQSADQSVQPQPQQEQPAYQQEGLENPPTQDELEEGI